MEEWGKHMLFIYMKQAADITLVYLNVPDALGLFPCLFPQFLQRETPHQGSHRPVSVFLILIIKPCRN
jgi:hypothetical protein